ncbi:hypothetical protein IJI86_02500 [Candidatus Saccharibacteria bacterium]|nr:hypothetical protein [Candidatus Saccharibacteria bacterium]
MSSDNSARKILNKIQVKSSLIFSCLGLIVAIFIPISILLLENGVEIRIDRLVMINDILSFQWFFGLLFLLILMVLIKIPIEGKNFLVARIFDLILFVLLFMLFTCSFVIFKNTISWLNDIPISLSTDNAYTSNPTLDSFLPTEKDKPLAVRLRGVPSYKKKTRITYIENTNFTREQELRWEMFLNDANTYKYEGGNDFWIYIREYYIFLNSIVDSEKEIASRGFKNINAHVKDIGASVGDSNDCMYMESTLLQLRFENVDWRAEMWAELVAKYMAVALIDLGVREDTRMCWLGSLPDYLLTEESGIGGDGHLKLLANALWNSFNSFEVQNSESRVMFYSDVPQYIVDFYTTLSGSANADDFYEYVKSMGG